VPDFDSIVTMRDLADDRRVTSLTVRIHRKNLLTKGIVVEAGFWIGLAVAIPLSIIANLVTPAAQNWLANRNTRLDYKRQKERAEMDRLIKELRANIMTYANFLSAGFMHLLLMAVLMIVVVNIPFYIQGLGYISLFVGSDYYSSSVFDGIARFVTIPLLMSLLVSFMNTIRKIRRVMREIVSNVPSSEL